MTAGAMTVVELYDLFNHSSYLELLQASALSIKTEPTW